VIEVFRMVGKIVNCKDRKHRKRVLHPTDSFPGREEAALRLSVFPEARRRMGVKRRRSLAKHPVPPFQRPTTARSRGKRAVPESEAKSFHDSSLETPELPDKKQRKKQ
jgi:hypothetical protein